MPQTCPTTSDAISERSHVLKCDQTYRYHCMRDKEDEIVEKCLKISWIQKGDCAVYDNDAQKIDSWTCIERQGICPKEVYFSNQVMSYSACVPLPEETNVSREKEVFKTSTIPSDGSQFANNDSTPQPWIIVSIMVLVAVIAIIGIIVICKRRKGSCMKRPSKATKRQTEVKGLCDPEEGMPLSTWTDSNNKPKSIREEARYDIDPYYRTRTYEHIEKLMEDSAVCILIVGYPGSGKSVIAEMLHDRFRRKKVNEAYFISEYMSCLEDVEMHQPHGKAKMIYILDDCFEDWIQYPHLTVQGVEKLKQIHQKIVENDGNCLVITISKFNFEENVDAIQKANLKQCDQLEVIDLTTKAFELGITDKIGILEYHRKMGKTAQRLDDNEIRKVTDSGILRSIVSYLDSDIKLEFEFPLSCRLFYSHSSFAAQKEEFFNFTKRHVRQYVRRLRSGSSDEQSQFCTLIYMALCGGKVKAQDRHNLHLLKGIEKAAETDFSDLHLNFECCLIIKGNDVYEILHDEITKLLFTSFGYAHTLFIIDNCAVEVLLKYVRTDDRQTRDKYRQNGFLIVTNNLYRRFSKRLQHLDEGKLKHVIFEDVYFAVRFNDNK